VGDYYRCEITPKKERDPIIEGLDPTPVRSRTAFQQSQDVPYTLSSVHNSVLPDTYG
jgi:hypothetical protein